MTNSDRPLLSIIVPVYNTGEYLRECMDSVLAQSFGDWEIILVDDGSTDESPAICDEIASLDERIRTFHKENEGQLKTRLFGIERAKGIYVTGLDSDDLYSSDALSVIEKTIKEALKEPDIVAFNLASFVHGADPLKEHEDIIQYPKEETLENLDFLKKILGNTDNSFCDKVIKKTLFDSCDLSDTPSHLRVSEDYMMIMPVASKALFVKVVPNVLYYYRQHEDSANHIVSGYRAIDELEAGEYVYNYLDREGILDEEIKQLLLRTAIGQFSFRLKEVIKSGKLSCKMCRGIYKQPFYKRLRTFETLKYVSKDKYVILKLLRFRCRIVLNILW